MALRQLQPHFWKDVARAAAVGRYRMSVDGGVRGTGIALWDSATWKKETSQPFLVASFVPSSSLGWTAAARRVMDHVNSAMLGMSSPTHLDAVYLEMPQYFGMGNAKGESVAARGDLQKLSIMTGMLASFGWQYDAKVRVYEVNAWKGQLSKKQTEDRIKRILPGLSHMVIADHGWDAVGIGLYAKGLFE
jgi:hypothetical protein